MASKMQVTLMDNKFIRVSDLKIGDIVEFIRKLSSYSHFGVYIGNDLIIHKGLHPGAGLWQGIHGKSNKLVRVQVDPIHIVAHDSITFRNNFLDHRIRPSEEQILLRAMASYDEDGYDALFNNCEHYACRIRYDEDFSRQTDILSAGFSSKVLTEDFTKFRVRVLLNDPVWNVADIFTMRFYSETLSDDYTKEMVRRETHTHHYALESESSSENEIPAFTNQFGEKVKSTLGNFGPCDKPGNTSTDFTSFFEEKRRTNNLNSIGALRHFTEHASDVYSRRGTHTHHYPSESESSSENEIPAFTNQFGEKVKSTLGNFGPCDKPGNTSTDFTSFFEEKKWTNNLNSIGALRHFTEHASYVYSRRGTHTHHYPSESESSSEKEIPAFTDQLGEYVKITLGNFKTCDKPGKTYIDYTSVLEEKKWTNYLNSKGALRPCTDNASYVYFRRGTHTQYHAFGNCFAALADFSAVRSTVRNTSTYDNPGNASTLFPIFLEEDRRLNNINIEFESESSSEKEIPAFTDQLGENVKKFGVNFKTCDKPGKSYIDYTSVLEEKTGTINLNSIGALRPFTENASYVYFRRGTNTQNHSLVSELLSRNKIPYISNYVGEKGTSSLKNTYTFDKSNNVSTIDFQQGTQTDGNSVVFLIVVFICIFGLFILVGIVVFFLLSRDRHDQKSNECSAAKL